jgi:hypothetical protein
MSTDKTINVQLEVTDELCRDLLTACYEGGSAYWLACDDVERDDDSNVVKIAGCVDREDDSTKWGDATLETIRTGIRKILANEAEVRSDIRGNVLNSVIDPENGDWDAEVADVVLQVGLLGEITYG